MVRVIRRKHWLRWCSRKGIDLDAAFFSLDTCYYGVSLRSRPGTLAVLPDRILHFSYSVWDTLWAIGESSIKIDIPLADIASICKQRLSLWLRIAQLGPDSHIRIQMIDNTIHDLFLQRDSTAFADVLRSLGHQVTAE